MVEEYIQAFLSCYPHKHIEVHPKTMKDRSIRYRVMIDRDGGDILLSEDDMRFATRLLRRGK